MGGRGKRLGGACGYISGSASSISPSIARPRWPTASQGRSIGVTCGRRPLLLVAHQRVAGPMRCSQMWASRPRPAIGLDA